MKFNEIGEHQWVELQPYLDTCLLPVTGLSGKEQPWQATETLRLLRDMLEIIEIPFKGRVVTYPAIQYAVDKVAFQAELLAICRNLKASGFKYIIIIAAVSLSLDDTECGNIIIDREKWAQYSDANSRKQAVYQEIQQIWHKT